MPNPATRSTLGRLRHLDAPWVVTMAIAAAGVMAYGRVLGGFFLGDDVDMILQTVGSGPRPGSVFSPEGMFRPGLRLTVLVDHLLWGPNPFGFHVTNLAGHILNALLVVRLADVVLRDVETDRTRRQRWAALAGTLFVVAPTHSEAVSWIAGRGDVFATTACLMALLAWTNRRHRGWRLISCAAFAAAILVKESAITFPIVLAAAEYWRPAPSVPGGRRARLIAAVRAPWPEYLVAAAYLALRIAYRGNVSAGYGDDYGTVGWRTVAYVPVALARSLLPGMSRNWWLLVAALVAVVVAVLVVVVGRGVDVGAARLGGAHHVTWIAVAAVATIVPILPLGVSLTDTGGERLVYLPSVFTILAVVLVVQRLTAAAPDRRLRGRRPGRSVAALSVVACVMSAVVLIGINGRWEAAGNASRALYGGAQSWPTDRPLILLSTVDNLGGAYVDRNLLGASLVLLEGWTPPLNELQMPTSLRLGDPGDRISVERSPGGGRDACAGCYVVTWSGPGSRVVDVWPLIGITTEVAPDGNSLTVRVAPELRATPVWWFDGAEMHRVSP